MSKKIFGGILHDGKVLNVVGTKGDTGQTGAAGPQGEQGAPFTYADFTTEQLETLRGPQGEQGPQGVQGVQGEKGDPFTYGDFTPQQLASLVGPQGPQGDSAVYDPSSPDTPDFVMANTTGDSTTKAMTQKAVTDEFLAIHKEMSNELTNYTNSNFTMKTDGTFAGNSSNKHGWIAVSEGDKFIYEAVTDSARYAFATSSSSSANTAIPLVTGTSVIEVSQYTSVIISIPAGCSYFLFNSVTSGIENKIYAYNDKFRTGNLLTPDGTYPIPSKVIYEALLRKKNYVQDKVIDSSGNILDSENGDFISTPIPIETNDSLYWKFNTDSTFAGTVLIYDSSMNRLASWLGWNGSNGARTATITTENAAYAVISFSGASGYTPLAKINNIIVWGGKTENGAVSSVDFKADEIRKDLNELGSDETVSILEFVGTNTVSSQKTRVMKSLSVEVGKTYQITLSSKSWSCADVASNANAFMADECLTVNVSSSQGYAVDLATVSEMKYLRPSNIPSLTLTYKATQPYTVFSFRGDEGETVTATIKQLSELSKINSAINDTQKQISDLIDGIGVSQDVVSVNGGKIELEAKFKALTRSKEQGGANQGNKICTLLYFSDLHGYTNILNRILEFDEAFPTYIDDMLHGGDTVNDEYGDANRISESEAPILNVIGNHDNWDASNKQGDSVNGRVLPTKLYTKFIKPFADIDGIGITQPTDAESLGLCYYYKDYVDSKLRLIVLDCMNWDEDEEDWLATTLASANTLGYTVIIADHYCPHSSWIGLRDCTFCSVTDGINTFLNSNAAEIVQNAIDNGLDFALWLFGHHHRDYFGYLADYPTQFAISIDKAANNTSHERDSYRDSVGRTVDCFNIIAIDTTCKVVTVMRIGNNRDKFMRQKNYLTFDYANGKIIGNS